MVWVVPMARATFDRCGVVLGGGSDAAAGMTRFGKATMYVGTKNHLRPTDEADFVALLRLLTQEQRAWLREAVTRVYVGEHPWMGRLS